MNQEAAIAVALAMLVVSSFAQEQAPPPRNPESGFRFESGVEVINVTAVVVDAAGRFVPGLLKDDFQVYEDDQPQSVTHFSAERMPVSLGIALDTSGSMAGEKIRAAQSALDRFLYDALDGQDEVFLYRFSDRPVLVQGWTADRQRVAEALGHVGAAGGTALYDTVAEAVHLAATGQHRKKALVLLSDGNDTTSRTNVRDVKRLIRQSEALVYAIGIDCGLEIRQGSPQGPRFQRRGPMPIPIPGPFPPTGRREWPNPTRPPPIAPPRSRASSDQCRDPVDVAALHEMTDDSGGRTEIVREPRDLAPQHPASPTNSPSSTSSAMPRAERKTAAGMQFE